MILPGKLPIKKMRPVFISTRFNLIYESAEERPVNTMVTSEIPTIAWGSAHEKLSTLSYKNNMAITSTIRTPRPTRLLTTAAKKSIINPKTIITYIIYLFNFNYFYIILPLKCNDFYFINYIKLVLLYLNRGIPAGLYL